MKTLIGVLSFLLILNCSSRVIPQFSLIDVDQWDAITISSLKEEMSLDTLLKELDSCCILSRSMKYSHIENVGFEQGMKNRLCYREKLIKSLKEIVIPPNTQTLHIEENIIFRYDGYGISGLIDIDNLLSYRFSYDYSTSNFIIEEESEKYDSKQELDDLRDKPKFFLTEAHCGVFLDFSITTLIEWDKKTDKLSYKIIHAYIE